MAPVRLSRVGSRSSLVALAGPSRLRDIARVQPSTPFPPAPASSLVTARQFLVATSVLHGVGFVLRFAYLWLDDVVRDESGTLLTRFLEEATGGFGAFVMSWTFYAAWRAAPMRGERAWRRAPALVALGVLASVANTSWMWGSRALIFPLAGLGDYDYGRMPLRYLMEAPQSLLGSAVLVGMLALMDEVSHRRARAAAAAELERTLLATQLQNLRLRLQPHFLFNALNTISATVHEDADKADALIGRLSELLRASLQGTEAKQVTLTEELVLLQAYVDLMRARFGERLRVDLDVDPATGGVLVPPFLLQPMVENAVRHGGLERSGRASVQVSARQAGGTLTLVVEDDGPGMPDGREALSSGTGLSSTARRLSLLHGAAALIVAGNRSGGGFSVRVTLPATTA